MAHLKGAGGRRLEYSTRAVFDSVRLGVREGDRVGIGRHGDGRDVADAPAGRR